LNTRGFMRKKGMVKKLDCSTAREMNVVF
jgi:hypothetical protein